MDHEIGTSPRADGLKAAFEGLHETEKVSRGAAPGVSGLHSSTLFVLLLACSTTSATPHGRQLQTTVSDVAGLTTALADPSIGHISLSAGTYPLASQLSISRDVTLEAAQPGFVVLDGQDSTRVVYIMSGTVKLIGLNITRGYTNGNGGGGAYISGSSTDVTFTNCHIYGNSASAGGGLFFSQGGATLTNCNIYSNTAPNGGGGIFIYGGTATFTKCDIYGNTAADYLGGGVYVDSGTVTFTDCNIYENTAEYGSGDNLYVSSSASVCLFDTELTGVYGSTSSTCPAPPSPPSPSLPPPSPSPPPPSPPPPSPSPPPPPRRPIDLLVTTTVAAVAVKIAQNVFHRRRREAPPPMPPPALPSFSHHCDNACFGTTCESMQEFTCDQLTDLGCDCGICCSPPASCYNSCGGTTCEALQEATCDQLAGLGCDCEGCCTSA